MKYFTAKTASVFRDKDKYVIGLGRGQFISTQGDFKFYNHLIEKFKHGVSIVEFNSILSGPLSEYLKNLLRARIIISSSLDYQNIPMNRELKNRLHLDLITDDSERVLRKFKETTFIIAGCGGIGNFLAYALSSYAVKKIVLVDFDVIEESNLNRQLMFSMKDLGRYKVDALKDRLLEINPSLEIDVEHSSFDSKNINRIVGKHPGNIFVALSADSSDIIPAISKKLPKLGIPFLNIGYLNDISVIGPFWINGDSACPMCGSMLGINEESEKLSYPNDQYSAPSSFINNSFSTAMAFSDIVSYFSDDIQGIQSLNNRVGIDNLNFSKYMIPVEKDINCEYCEIY